MGEDSILIGLDTEACSDPAAGSLGVLFSGGKAGGRWSGLALFWRNPNTNKPPTTAAATPSGTRQDLLRDGDRIGSASILSGSTRSWARAGSTAGWLSSASYADSLRCAGSTSIWTCGGSIGAVGGS